MGKKSLTTAAILLIIAGAAGYYLGVSEGAAQCVNEINRYQKAIDSIFPPPPEQIFTIDGTIKEIGDRYLILETYSFSEGTLPGEEFIKEERKIIVSENTEITKRKPMEFEFATEGGAEVPIVKEEKYSFAELKIGDSVIVEADENIKNKIEFVAEKIIMEEIEMFPLTEE